MQFPMVEADIWRWLSTILALSIAGCGSHQETHSFTVRGERVLARWTSADLALRGAWVRMIPDHSTANGPGAT